MPASSTPPATENYEQQVGWLRRNISEADEGGGALTMGVLPARSIVVGAGVIVATGFNGTSPILQIGTSGDGDGFATNLILATIGNIVWDELATSNDLYSTSEVTVSCTVSATGNDSTAGYGVVYVQYIQDNGLGRSS
jgi:hypothetical protein